MAEAPVRIGRRAPTKECPDRAASPAAAEVVDGGDPCLGLWADLCCPLPEVPLAFKVELLVGLPLPVASIPRGCDRGRVRRGARRRCSRDCEFGCKCECSCDEGTRLCCKGLDVASALAEDEWPPPPPPGIALLLLLVVALDPCCCCRFCSCCSFDRCLGTCTAVLLPDLAVATRAAAPPPRGADVGLRRTSERMPSRPPLPPPLARAGFPCACIV